MATLLRVLASLALPPAGTCVFGRGASSSPRRALGIGASSLLAWSACVLGVGCHAVRPMRAPVEGVAESAPLGAWTEDAREGTMPPAAPSSWATAEDEVLREVEGWTVRLGRELAERPEVAGPALEALGAHLNQVAILVRAEQLAQLRTVTIQVDLDHPLRNLQYHPSRGWLEANGYAPELARCVHVPRAASLTSRDLHAVQPRVILHELAHAYHDQVLGFDHAGIRAAFEAAVAGGRYEEVLHVNGRTVRHYALTNHKEYFAEGTEAYFGANDFHPFVRAELAQHDPGLFALLREVWGPLP